jgi:hypothetical protein
LFGLAEYDGQRSVASVGGGRDDRPVNLVSLGHGDRWTPPHRWVEVAVLGPLHGTLAAHAGFPAGGSWSVDAESMPLFFLATAAFPAARGDEIPDIETGLLSRGWGALELTIDGAARGFRCLREGDHWVAVTELQPDHALYVCASYVEPAEISLQRIRSLGPYLATTQS